MTAEDWRRFAPFDGTGTINVCGPVTFMEDAAAAISEGRMGRPTAPRWRASSPDRGPRP